MRVADALCRYRGLAPWVAVVITVAIQVAALSYSYGSLSQRQNDFEYRLQVIEASDKDQARQIGESASRLARIEEGVTYIREAVRGGK